MFSGEVRGALLHYELLRNGQINTWSTSPLELNIQQHYEKAYNR